MIDLTISKNIYNYCKILLALDDIVWYTRYSNKKTMKYVILPCF